MLIFLLGCSDYEVNRRVLRDSYVQPGRSTGVDILWVVDNSASMFEEQDQLIAHASSFIGFLSLCFSLFLSKSLRALKHARTSEETEVPRPLSP